MQRANHPSPMRTSGSAFIGVLAALALAVIAILAFLLIHKPKSLPVTSASPAATTTAPHALAYDPQPVVFPIEGNPVITHVAIADLDRDGLQDILVCDAHSNTVNWIRQSPRGVFNEQVLGETIPGPAHVSVCDMNGDGLPDLLVASMGMILPNNDRIGRVVVLENLGGGKFRNRVLAEDVARVTDVRGADLNGDGKIDLVVGQFGYNQGEIRWMENLGDWKFRSHVVLNLPGTIMTPVADYDGDGRLDFARSEERRVGKE